VTTTITLPWPPTSNHAYATVRSGISHRRVKSANARNYAAVAGIITRRLHPTPPFTVTDRIRVHLVLHPPDGRRFDIANREKILIDAIAGILGFDDNQIDFIAIERQHVTAGGAAIVTVATHHPNAN
jgi:Holliday junction resolvase RusA-like endonuclease